MDSPNYCDGQLFAEDCAVEAIAAQHGTPCYIYSRATLESAHAFNDAIGEQAHLVCYAVKANSNLRRSTCLPGWVPADIVSQGELLRVLRAGGDPKKTVFSGVGKKAGEIRFALETGIRCFNVESVAELERIQAIAAEMNVTGTGIVAG
ncbi:MAG: hypothetical protein R3E95_20115 [Thiolinea sp.]